jgi:hypothetical protein
MSVTITAHNSLSALAVNGAAFGAVLAALSSLPDAAHAALPDAWRDLSASLVGMIADDQLSAQAVADASGLPLEAVRAFAFNLELV